MAALTESEFKATMGDPMTIVAPDDDFRRLFESRGVGIPLERQVVATLLDQQCFCLGSKFGRKDQFEPTSRLGAELTRQLLAV